VQPFEAEHTYLLRDRDLNCGDFSYDDLRRVDLSGSSLIGTNLKQTRLEGASLSGTYLEGAVLVFAEFQRADLDQARLRGAKMKYAQLQGANLRYAQLQGADVQVAGFQGADLSYAELQGANLSNVRFQGASLYSAHLQGALLYAALLQGADLRYAKLEGALLSDARLEGADLTDAELQGADLSNANLDHSLLTQVSVWRARRAECTNGRIAALKTEGVIEISGDSIQATPDTIAQYIQRLIADIPDAKAKAEAANRMSEGLNINIAQDDLEATAKRWSKCAGAEISTMSSDKFDEERAAVLKNLACDALDNPSIAQGIIRNWVSEETPSVFSIQLARHLLDKNTCQAMVALIKRLQVSSKWPRPQR
jgi:uncharacterized protein YjbI with pentapeptide repeats